jgi:hypothetical protein
MDPTEASPDSNPACVCDDVLDLLSAEHFRRIQASPQQGQMLVSAVFGDSNVEA